MPEDKGVSAQVAMTKVAATVFVNHRFLVGDGKDTGDGGVVLEGDPDLKSRPK
jgi:hypothetical protein